MVGPTILICCVADAALTAAILEAGGREANPVMGNLPTHAGWALKVAVPLAIWIMLPYTTSRWLHHTAYVVAVVYAGIVGWGLAVLAHV